MENSEAGVRELFIDELAEVKGGSDNKIVDWIRDQLTTTYACGEEGPSC